MRFISQRGPGRTFYASEEQVGDGVYLYTLSAMEVAVAGRRPVALFGSKQELEREVARRGGEVVWQIS